MTEEFVMTYQQLIDHMIEMRHHNIEEDNNGPYTWVCQKPIGKSVWAQWLKDGLIKPNYVYWAFKHENKISPVFENEKKNEALSWLAVRFDNGRGKIKEFDLTTYKGRSALKEFELQCLAALERVPE